MLPGPQDDEVPAGADCDCAERAVVTGCGRTAGRIFALLLPVAGMPGEGLRPGRQERTAAGDVVADCRVGDPGCPVLADQKLVDVPGCVPVLRPSFGVGAEDAVDRVLVWVQP